MQETSYEAIKQATMDQILELVRNRDKCESRETQCDAYARQHFTNISSLEANSTPAKSHP